MLMQCHPVRACIILMYLYIGRKESVLHIVLNDEAKEQLKQYFEKKEYVTKAMLNEIEKNFGLDEKFVRIWFSNQRRKKKKIKGYVKSTILSLSFICIDLKSTLVPLFGYCFDFKRPVEYQKVLQYLLCRDGSVSKWPPVIKAWK